MLDIKFKLFPGHTSKRDWMRFSSLEVLFWNITYKCNFNCSICFTDAPKKYPKELSTNEAKNLIDMAAREGVRDIIISGGEPFSRPDIIEILSYMKKARITTRIATNGSLLDDSMLKVLKEKTSVKSFQVSLDTLDPDLYASFHNVDKGMLSKVLDILPLIKEQGFHTTISTRLTPETLPGMPELLDFASKEGMATFTVHYPLLVGREQGAYSQEMNFLSLLSPVFDKFLSLKKKWLIEMYIPWAQYHPVIQKLAHETDIIYCGCSAGRNRLTVNPGGDVSLCVCFDVKEEYLGNVKTDSIKDIFENSKIAQIMKNPVKFSICEDCENVAICGGGCRVAAYVLSGKIDGQDSSCPVWKEKNRSS
ncbi:radical SAM/SPASM domain-containing protein [Spirochaetota bacterium]